VIYHQAPTALVTAGTAGVFAWFWFVWPLLRRATKD
jgi:hypothetical protein